MRSRIKPPIEEAASGNDLRCSAHGNAGPNCSGRVVAIVTLADAGSERIRWNVCQWWLDNTPEVQQL
ncbi:hypothetical protein ACGFZK_20675 [Streptomyces sp. NPDC048257]|uniref:hypothetical protein n=1 Tax=Streptomyces sp. NPDC048257 TaxID=3365526 RepID=UPI0037223C6B